jgi:hypothetical protein
MTILCSSDPANQQVATFSQISLSPMSLCKDAYASVRLHRDMVGNVDSSDYICRRVDVKVRLSLEI